MSFFNKTALKNIKSIDNRYNKIYTVDEELLNFTIGGGSTCTNILQSVLFVNIPISERKETVNSTHIVVMMQRTEAGQTIYTITLHEMGQTMNIAKCNVIQF